MSIVTLSSRTALHTPLPSSGFATSVTLVPVTPGKHSPTISPNAWKSGRLPRMRSVPYSQFSCRQKLQMFAVML